MTTTVEDRPATEEIATTLETEVCSRCGGTGHYSYCQRYGTTCFKCHGAKRVYTKRGAMARVFMEQLLSIPAKDIKPGMKVRALIITEGGEIGGEKWSVVEAITDNAVDRRCGIHRDGQVIYEGLNIVSKEMTFCGVNPEAMYRVAASKEVKAAALKQAIEYQNSLTKTGKPRKRT